jgi:hypothetical protein
VKVMVTYCFFLGDLRRGDELVLFLDLVLSQPILNELNSYFSFVIISSTIVFKLFFLNSYPSSYIFYYSPSLLL